ncbi:MAG: TldD/PmbA family protein [Actinomycetota bacterium]|nr:TldD/PmbA family protein [Actinomycetota bacterium]
MIDKERIREALKTAINYSTADQLEVIASSRNIALTRFSNNYIHQNVAETNMSISIRAVVGKRLGYASTNRLDKDSIENVVDKAIENAVHRPPDLDFVSLPEPKQIAERDLIARSTIEYTPKERAADVLKFINIVSPHNLVAAGAFSTGYSTIGVANSLGVSAVEVISEAELKAVVMSDTSSAYASAISTSASSIDIERLATTAKETAIAAQNPIELAPGRYTVVLSPDAVADMISFMAFAGFGALSLQEGRSFMKDRFGEKILSPLVSIWDNAFDPNTIGLTFDFEGVPKQKIVFIENGVAKGVCYDSYTANKEGKESTGHALPAPNTYGPLPLNLVMAAGDSSLDDMIKSCERGILVSRFHYTNLEDPIKTILTGMTRDGTFLIEDGEIKTPIKNLRFTQSIIDALSRVELISRDRILKDAILGAVFVPWVKISEFNFTGATQF